MPPADNPDRLSVAALYYLNTVPLLYSYYHQDLPSWLEITLLTPAECAEMLARGEAQAGLIPLFQYQRIPGLSILPGLAIASAGPVRSVLLVSRCELGKIRRIWLSSQSRTSVALIRVIMGQFRQQECIYQTGLPSLDQVTDTDGLLIIGDDALRQDWYGWCVYDLAWLWREQTGLPFVFAFWVVRPHPLVPQLQAYLEESRRQGLTHLVSIAREYAVKYNLEETLVRNYLRHHLHYQLGEPEIASLRLFYQLCHQQRLIPKSAPWSSCHAGPNNRPDSPR